ncbi:glyoxylate/hydroxypyruvate reductase A [soil metagenome]
MRVVVWPEDDVCDAEVAVCWCPPAGIYQTMPKLRLVQGIAAGVDNLLVDQRLDGIAVCRVIDPGQRTGMEEYVLWAVLWFQRNFDQAVAQQRTETWSRTPYAQASATTIGVMGLGSLGMSVGQRLAGRGYKVRGWSRTHKDVTAIEVYSGSAGYDAFLSGTNILVCLLPLTRETNGILDRRTFASLPGGASVIHVGRGDHLVEADLRSAIVDGHIRGAVIDVFEQEPLPAGHPLWSTPGVVVTPHMATMADSALVLEQLTANVNLVMQGAARLLNQVDIERGY